MLVPSLPAVSVSACEGFYVGGARLGPSAIGLCVMVRCSLGG
jgi:hypothetical protein